MILNLNEGFNLLFYPTAQKCKKCVELGNSLGFEDAMVYNDEMKRVCVDIAILFIILTL